MVAYLYLRHSHRFIFSSLCDKQEKGKRSYFIKKTTTTTTGIILFSQHVCPFKGNLSSNESLLLVHSLLDTSQKKKTHNFPLINVAVLQASFGDFLFILSYIKKMRRRYYLVCAYLHLIQQWGTSLFLSLSKLAISWRLYLGQKQASQGKKSMFHI